MQRFVITTDNGSDIGLQLADKFSIDMLCLTVNVNGTAYDGVNKSIDMDEIYSMMKRGFVPSTSQATPDQAEKFFEKYLNQGVDVIHVCLSSQISGTYNSCMVAAINLQAKYPDRKIQVIDSISASLGQAMLVIKGVKQQSEGKNFDEVVEFLKQKRHHICHIFTVDNLVYLQRGGRVSKAEVIVGSLIGIKPILSCDSQGKLVPISKVRGRQKSLIYMVNKMAEVIRLKENNFLTICHGGCIEEANYVAQLLREKFNINDIIIEKLGPIIGSHAGPGTIGIFFESDYRLDRK